MIILGAVGMSIFLNYWIILPILPLTVLFAYVRRYFIACSLEVKRIDGICKKWIKYYFLILNKYNKLMKSKGRSPIFVHLNNTLSGLVLIRAANKQEKINKEFYEIMDFHTRSVTTFLYINRWFAIRLGKLLTSI